MADLGPGEQPGAHGVVAVVVVTYQSADHLDACLSSMHGDLSIGTVVVVDSGSPDVELLHPIIERHAAALPIELRALSVNVGFGAACNRGAAATSEPFLLFLNPDTELGPRCSALLTEAIERGRTNESPVAVAGPAVLNPDGSMYPSARSFPSLWRSAAHAFLGVVRPGNRFSAGYLRPPNGPDWVSGTAMAVRRDAFESIGGFDEGYFMYVEDVDLCWRFSQQGWSVVLTGDAFVTHHIGGSSRHRPLAMAIAHHRSLWRFACRSSTGIARLALPAVFCGLVARAVLVSAMRLFDKRPAAARHGQSPT